MSLEHCMTLSVQNILTHFDTRVLCQVPRFRLLRVLRFMLKIHKYLSMKVVNEISNILGLK